MSANVYTIESLLVGKTYRSKTLTGEIISAEKHPKAVWYENAEAYLVEVRDSLRNKIVCRTLAVRTND
jgi:adenylate cyclase